MSGFEAAVQENYRDHTTLAVYCDWLRDGDEPLADGYAFAVAYGFVPYMSDTSWPRSFSWWNYGRNFSADNRYAYAFPSAWFRDDGKLSATLYNKLPASTYLHHGVPNNIARFFRSAWEAYKAFALAYTKLSVASRNKLALQAAKSQT